MYVISPHNEKKTGVVDISAVIAYDIEERDVEFVVIAKTFRADLDYEVHRATTRDGAIAWITSIEDKNAQVGMKHKVVPHV